MLAILTTHPIQYQVPIWQALASQGSVPFEVWYLSDHGVHDTLDAEFGQRFRWDLDLLTGYPYRFVSRQPERGDLTRFRGLSLPNTASLLREHGVRALWVNGWQHLAYWQAVFAAHRAGIPVWLRGDSNDLSRRSWPKHVLRRLALGALFRRVPTMLYVGSANRRLYEQFGVAAERLVWTPHCVDNARFAGFARTWAPRRTELRRAWGVPAEAVCFLFCGKLVPRKRPMDLLDAVGLLLHADPELGASGRVHVIVAGTGTLRPALEARARELADLCGRRVVTFVGFLNQTEVPRAYVVADCLVLPSNSSETWGLVVNEALACGTPVLVSDQCGCAEDLARPLDPRAVYECGDVPALAERMRERVRDHVPGKYRVEAQSLAGRFDISHTVRAVQRTYDGLSACPAERAASRGIA
jgi:glycosyltransferase involved in cell wall biosynthesis